jgi:flagella basal body P-ring formation protein FlgA
MKLLRLITYLWLASCALAQTPCLTVTGDQILVSDLARAVPVFAHVSPHAQLAPSPMPGNTRVFSPSELQAFAARFSVAVGSPHEVCFRFATEALNPDRIVASMRNALQIPDVRIEIMETSPAAGPAGIIEFTKEYLGIPAASDSRTPVPWRGDIIYAGNRRFPIWTKVRISVSISRSVAVEALRSGVAIKASQVRTELVEGFPMAASKGFSVDQIVGMMPVRPIASGAEIRPDNLVRPNDVSRGDLVQVEVHFGAAHLSLTGRAESAGHVGDTVTVQNPDTSKVFQALVEGVDKVIVGPPGSEISRSQGD